MNQHETTPFTDKFYGRFLGLLSPFSAIVVEYNSLMLSLKGIPCIPFSYVGCFIFTFDLLMNLTKGFVRLLDVILSIGLGSTNSFDGFGLGGGFHFHGKAFRCLQGGMQGIRRTYPVVVVLTINN